jgi:hypothetical protein
MELRKFIVTTIREYLNEQQVLNENVKNEKLIPVTPNKYVYHKSNIKFREEISKFGLITKGKSETWLSDTEIDGNVIFATNSDNKKDWFDSTYDDDIYQIDTTKINNKWFLDPNFTWEKSPKHIITFDNIPLTSISLIYKGSGTDLLEQLNYNDVIKKQQIDNPYSDTIFSNETSKFVEETISIEKLRQLNGFSEDDGEIEQSVSYFNDTGMDEDYYVSKKLMTKIVDDVKLSPIVVDETYKILDGSHRLAAYSELYYNYSYDYPFDGKLKIYKRISN